MKKINNIFDCLENAEGRDMERITNKTPQLDSKQIDRILEMSERKYNIKKRNEINTNYSDGEGYQTAAEGVEEYSKRPIWMRYAAAAAALVLTGGIVAASMSILKNRNSVPNVPTVPNIAATTVVTTAVTTDEESAELTTVTADLSAEVTGTMTADITETGETTSTTASQSTSANAQANTTASQQQNENTATAVPNALTEDECRAVIEQREQEYIKYAEIDHIPCTDYLDFSDSFIVKAHADPEAYAQGHPYIDDGKEFNIRFVHYVDPSFPTIEDMKNFVADYLDRWYGGNGISVETTFGQTIVPGQTIIYELYRPELLYVYTVYNGKIYRGVDEALEPSIMESHDDFVTSERQALRLGRDYFRNITDSSFEDYRITLDGDGDYYGHYRYYYKENGQWRADISKERELTHEDCLPIVQG